MILNAERVRRDVIVVAASAGGLPPLCALCAALAPDVPAGVAVVFHRSAFVDGQILAILQRAAHVPVIEPNEREPFARGAIFLAPRDQHILLEDGAFRLSRGPKLHSLRPAADPLFCSAAAAYGERVLGVVLSGGGFDGAQGALAIKGAGGMLLTQAVDDAIIPFMPAHTIEHDHVDAALPLTKLVLAITALAHAEELEV